MNQQDTTMMIAAQVVAALAAQNGENTYDPKEPSDFIEDAEGSFIKGQNDYFYQPNSLSGALKDQPRFKLKNTYEDRIARYAARIANKTVNAVQAELNK